MICLSHSTNGKVNHNKIIISHSRVPLFFCVWKYLKIRIVFLCQLSISKSYLHIPFHSEPCCTVMFLQYSVSPIAWKGRGRQSGVSQMLSATSPQLTTKTFTNFVFPIYPIMFCGCRSLLPICLSLQFKTLLLKALEKKQTHSLISSSPWCLQKLVIGAQGIDYGTGSTADHQMR